MQLVAGQVAQRYNRRKKRCGAFWQGRYHATAVQTGRHLRRCMTYIDLNMVRTGKVSHPRLWCHGGYQRIQNPLQKECILDISSAIRCLKFPDLEELQKWQLEAVRLKIQSPTLREAQWTQAIGVGDPAFLDDLASSLNLTDHKHSQENGILHDDAARWGLSRKLL